MIAPPSVNCLRTMPPRTLRNGMNISPLPGYFSARGDNQHIPTVTSPKNEALKELLTLFVHVSLESADERYIYALCIKIFVSSTP